MIRNVLTYPDPVLKVAAKPVTEVTPEIRQLAADMAETMYQYDGIGLAAPQVGVLLRLVTIDLSGPEVRDSLMTLVNPVLTPLGDEQVESEEGCLSVEDYRSTVVRYERVHLSATDLEGKEISFDADGLLAVCLQHECDHLEGRLFIDKISRLKRNLYDAKVKKWARRNH